MCQDCRWDHYQSDFPELDDEKWKVNFHNMKREGEG